MPLARTTGTPATLFGFPHQKAAPAADSAISHRLAAEEPVSADLLDAAGTAGREFLNQSLAAAASTLPIDPRALDASVRMIRGGGPLIEEVAAALAGLNPERPVLAAHFASLALTLPPVEHAAFARGFARQAADGPALSLAQLVVRSDGGGVHLALRPASDPDLPRAVRAALAGNVKLSADVTASFGTALAEPLCALFGDPLFRAVLETAVVDCCRQWRNRHADRAWGSHGPEGEPRDKSSAFTFAGRPMRVHLRRSVVLEMHWPTRVGPEHVGEPTLEGVARLYDRPPQDAPRWQNALAVRHAAERRLATDPAFADYGGLWRPEAYFGSDIAVFKVALGIGPDGALVKVD